MRPESLNWLKQAKEDLKTAKINVGQGRWYVVAFFCQQSAEKALKAMIIEEKRVYPDGHGIIEFGRAAKAPKQVLTALVDLNADYAVARYPDAANGVPADAYDETIAKRKLDNLETVWKWVKKWTTRQGKSREN